MDTNTCIINSSTSVECENAESRLRGNNKDAFLFNLTMNPQRDPDKKRIRKPEETKSERPRDGKEDQRYLSLLEREIERRKALNLSRISFQVGQGGGRAKRRQRRRKKKRTQKRRRKKRKRRTRR